MDLLRRKTRTESEQVHHSVGHYSLLITHYSLLINHLEDKAPLKISSRDIPSSLSLARARCENLPSRAGYESRTESRDAEPNQVACAQVRSRTRGRCFAASSSRVAHIPPRT